MRKLTKQVTEVYGYEAVDGTYFHTEEDCLRYENNYRVVIYSAYKRRVLCQASEYDILDVGCDENIIDMVSIKNKDDLTAVNQYIATCYSDGNRQLDESVIGTTQLIEHYADAPFDWIFPMGTIEDYTNKVLKKYQDKLASVSDK